MNGRDGIVGRRWALLAILLLAFGLRLYRLGAESLWYDETVSVYLAGQSLPDLVAHTAGDIHPPGYYLLLHAWTRLAGSSDFAVAFPSLWFGLLLVALAYWLGARVYGPRAGLLAALLAAISPYNVWYSQEVRMYTLGAALGLGLLAAVLRLIEGASAGPIRRPWAWLAVYALCGALGLWTLYYFAFLLLATNLMVGLWWLVHRQKPAVGWPWLGRWALAQGAVLLLYAPWIPVAWRQATNPPVPPWRGLTGLGQVLVEVWSALCLGQSVDPARVWPVLLLFAALFGLGLLLARSARFREPGSSGPWLLAGHVFLPVALIYLVSFVTPLYHVRYAFTYSTPFYVVVGAGLAWLWARWRPAAWLSLAAIVLFSGVSLYRYHTDPAYASDDHRAAVDFLAERWRPGDAILVNAGYTYTALLTYWDRATPYGGDPIAWRGRLVGGAPADWAALADEGPVLVQTGTVDGDPSLGWGDPESDFYAMSRQETAEALERLFAAAHRVWVYRIYDTVTDPQATIRDWLDAHGTIFEDRVFTGESQLRVQGYLAGRQPPAEVQETLQTGRGLDFGGPPSGGLPFDGPVLRYLGTDPLQPPPTLSAASGWLGPPPPIALAEVGGVFDLALYWQRLGPLSPGAESLSLFAGLTGGRAIEVWAQTDEQPSGPLLPVQDWPQGAVVRTPLRIRIPPGTPPGPYYLMVGWYYFVDGQPLWLAHGSAEKLALGQGTTEPLRLGYIDVRAPQDWAALPLPEPAYAAGVTLGSVRLLGLDAPSLEARPGEALRLDLWWQALQDGPEQAGGVLLLTTDGGQVLAEAAAPPAGGRGRFTGLEAGQVVRDPRTFVLPAGLAPGAYNLSVGRRTPGGTWLPVRRGPLSLGETYPLATVRVLP